MGDQPEREIIHRELDTGGESPATQVPRIIAGIEGREPTDLATMYDCVDDILDDLFSDPPAPEAQMRVEFSYEGYRITIEQNGTTAFVKTG